MVSYLQLPGCFHPLKDAEGPDGGDGDMNGGGGGEGEKEREGGLCHNNYEKRKNPLDLHSTSVPFNMHKIVLLELHDYPVKTMHNVANDKTSAEKLHHLSTDLEPERGRNEIRTQAF